MSEWGVALIAAGSAVAGSIVTGWYARGAGIRQAEAARHAGDRQAEALLESVRITVRADAEQRARAERRRVYAEFLAAAEARILTERTGRGGAEDEAVFQRALGLILLEGPAPVAEAARGIAGALRGHVSPDELEGVKSVFIGVARGASGGTG
ncbi:hypothetical protein [Streptomyces acidiscabies]|uniref:hypothetical protein n=1 Tax=Streptomyces acidiscabies TaxID=42234 RepID=UPI00073EA988|nr:hypothetical protein [Streptomyces acidiscabies]GAQ58246.1 hypothetical protein a10_08133 [Streptomyces acidiscabies]